MLAIAAWMTVAVAHGQEPPSYARQVRPFFAKFCLECHNPKSVKGGLDLETVKAMLEGGNKGDVLTPGKPDQSRLILMMEGKAKPEMPPKEARFRPKTDEIALVRAWVKAGAKDDSGLVKAEIPDIKPGKKAAPPIRALAFLPGENKLVAGHHRELLWDAGKDLPPAKKNVSGIVTGLAFQPRGDLLAVALAEPGASGRVELQSWKGSKTPPVGAAMVHGDSILDVVFSPNGKWLATSSYDTLIHLTPLDDKYRPLTLKEHSDAVYGLAFSPDSKLLASCSADRAVKVWDVATGKLLYTLGEANDWLYTLAWSPDGQHLASAGVDKSIRVYRVDAAGGKISQSVFAHEAPVQKILYSQDGKTLYSLGQDGVLKAWDSERMVERRVFERLPETGLTFAVQGNEVAVGLYNGTIRLFDAATGKPQRDITAQVQEKPKPMPPEIAKITPASGQRGSTHRLLLQGKHLDQVTEIVAAGAKTKLVAVRPDEIDAEITIPPAAPAGPVAVKVKSPAGESKEQSFIVDLFPLVAPAEGNDSPGTGQLVKLSASVAGKLDKAGDIDYYRFEAKPGQQLGVQLLTKTVGSKIDPYLQLVDPRGRLLAESSDGVLGHVFPDAGTYAVGVRDRELRGGADMHYRLHLGEIPVVISLFPLGLERGQETDIRVKGVFLSADKVRVKVAADAAPGSKVSLSIPSALGQILGPREIVVGEFPETLTAQKPHEKAPAYEGVIAVPGTANGYLHLSGQKDVWKFRAKKGERLILEVNARRLGSGLDSILEVLDEKNKPVPRAVLRCQAKTYVTFRDHDSAPNIRIEAWSELGVNDYMFVGGELMRIKELPTHPDADCFFFSAGGQRQGFLDTTPVHHSMNEPMYKVMIHPPGSAFPPNGYPVFTLFYQNDDGGPGYARDSRILFEAPADGDYRVRISDSRGQAAGDNFGYRLTIRPPRPSFNVSVNPAKPALSKGGAIPITVNAERLDGYDGPIAIDPANLPDGLHAPATFIEAGQNSTAFSLYADEKASAKAQPFKLIASALIDGKKHVKEAQLEAPKVMEPGEIVCWTEQSEVTLKPGGQTKLTVHIERRQGFTGRVPLEVKGLPHGVRVLDLGLNGILVNENEVRRTIVIYAEPWVDVPAHPFVVLAKREGKNSEHAAKSVLLKVAR
ncbi:MAG: hypothetical protein L0Y72_28135 [Gemmataceae bacterium]|nr:hypothetical protein [Gemmataceae bacterium]